jgi:hypothetical protein
MPVVGITLLIGLPGSGKTSLARKMAAEDPSVRIIDDPRTKADLVVPDDGTDVRLAICDPMLCDPESSERADAVIAELFPNATVERLFFAADPDACARNARTRADGRLVEALTKRLAARYVIPDGVEAIPIPNATPRGDEKKTDP